MRRKPDHHRLHRLRRLLLPLRFMLSASTSGVRSRPALAFLGASSLILGLTACGKPAAAPTKAPPTSECPPGQTFDGQFCQVTGAPPPEAAPAAAAAPAAESGTAVDPASSPTPAAAATPAVTPAGAAEPPLSLATPVDVSMAAQAGPLITYLAGSHL